MWENFFLTSLCILLQEEGFVSYSIQCCFSGFFFYFILFAAPSLVQCSFVNYIKYAAKLITGTHCPPR